MLYTVDELFGADTVGIVVIGRGAAARGNACELSAMHPIQVGIGFCTVVISQGIAACIIVQVIGCVADFDGRQQVCPLAIVIVVVLCRACRAYSFCLRKEVACGIVFVGIGLCDVAVAIARAVVVDLGGKLILVIIGVGNQQIVRTCSLTNLGNVSDCIIDILVARDKSAIRVALDTALSTRQGCAFRCAALFRDGLAERKGVNRRQHTTPSPVLQRTVPCARELQS